MTSRRPPSDGGSSRAAELPGGCRQIGQQLAGVRAARQVSVEEVASQLILSKAQVLGLEHANAAAFYSTTYFLKALRKYMAFAEVPTAVLDEAMAEAAEGDAEALRLTLADTAPAGLVATRVPGRLWAAAAAVVALAVIALGISKYRPAVTEATGDPDTVRLSASAPLPAHPLRLSAVASPPVRTVPAATTLDPLESDATVRLTVGKATWVFVRFPDNHVAEHRLAAGEELEVGPLPVYLVIGTADAVDLRIEDRPVAIEPYIRNGQVRITKSQLAALKGPREPD